MEESNKRKRTLEMVMSSFTNDLWIEIFLRLPIKPLLRFKSVSKSWLSIISSHGFAKSHLASTNAKDDDILIAHHTLGCYEEDDGSFSLFHLDLGRTVKNLLFPYSQGEYTSDPISSILIGSDCGIVCVSLCVSDCRAVNKGFDLYLWNPATKHSALLPPPTILEEFGSSGTIGFGFDHIDLDFKVVRVVSSSLSAELYSSNTNTWRIIQTNPTNFPYCSRFRTVYHGFLLALGCSSTMVAFDLNKEVFICGINLPVSSFNNAGEDDIQTSITDFKDSIAVINSDLYNGKIDLWTLDDDACVFSGGVEAMWTKVLSIDVGVSLDFVDGLFNNVEFLLLESEGDRFLYDWNNKLTTYVPRHPYLESGEFFKYKKSLFSLVGFKRIKWAASSPRLQDLSDWDEQMDE